ncbi:hypothetical protein Ocin01_18540 [Orchesella cincta]|uniref:Uncharacterized protein n=1 Tax=Orchesella cincta TaxID=48709 RepID=A0A1D2M591_ORCCI|nr:hypothetical protein Ocin01_18540 [Orchesella cincta]
MHPLSLCSTVPNGSLGIHPYQHFLEKQDRFPPHHPIQLHIDPARGIVTGITRSDNTHTPAAPQQQPPPPPSQQQPSQQQPPQQQPSQTAAATTTTSSTASDNTD